MKHKDKEKKCCCGENCNCEETCNCDETCTCGCKNGEECTCGDTCTCGEECECHKEKSHHSNSHHEKIEKLENELKEEKEKSLRIQAEMINFKRRQEESLATYKKYANESILKELLLIKDNFERGLSLENEENKEIFKGFRMIYQNIDKILEENQVTEINAIDVEFDPAVHQAVMTEHKDGVQAGMVIDCLQKGYKYKDRVLRPAMVKVSE